MNTTTVYLRTPRGNPARLVVREGTSDLSVAGSVFEGVAASPLVDEYRLAELYISGRFVDVGAHIGCVAIAVLLDNPGATALLVEPVPENVAMIRANLEANDLASRATILIGAVGTNAISYGYTGTETAETNRFIGNLTVPTLRGSTRIEVRRFTLSDLLPAEALKTDCEGGEWSLFAEPAITTIPTVFGEYHGKPGAKGVLAKFGKTHKVAFDSMESTTGTFRAVAK